MSSVMVYLPNRSPLGRTQTAQSSIGRHELPAVPRRGSIFRLTAGFVTLLA